MNINELGWLTTGDWCSGAGRGQTILAKNRYGRMLWLNTMHRDDGDDVGW